MMDDDLTFRISLLVLFLGARYVRWHARHLTTWKANWPAMKRHPLDTTVLLSLSVAWVSVVVLYVAFPALVMPFHIALPAWLRWCAVATAMAGLGLLWWSDRCLGENLSVTLKIRDDHTLISHGPYARIRHPIYTATLIYAASLGLITANYVLAAMLFVPMALLVALRLGSEEKMMLEQFGDAYRQYMQQTHRLVPRLRSRHP